MTKRPRTLAVTFEEGGEWISFPVDWKECAERRFKDDNMPMARQVAMDARLVHSIKFDGGFEWDVVNGWRKFLYKRGRGRYSARGLGAWLPETICPPLERWRESVLGAEGRHLLGEFD